MLLCCYVDYVESILGSFCRYIWHFFYVIFGIRYLAECGRWVDECMLMRMSCKRVGRPTTIAIVLYHKFHWKCIFDTQKPTDHKLCTDLICKNRLRLKCSIFVLFFSFPFFSFCGRQLKRSSKCHHYDCATHCQSI